MTIYLTRDEIWFLKALRAAGERGRLVNALASRTRLSEIGIAGIAAFIGGAAILSDCNAAGFFQGKSTDAAKPQAVSDSSVHAASRHRDARGGDI
jgi:hypothetical protein